MNTAQVSTQHSPACGIEPYPQAALGVRPAAWAASTMAAMRGWLTALLLVTAMFCPVTSAAASERKVVSPPAAKGHQARTAVREADLPATRDALFGLDDPPRPATPPPQASPRVTPPAPAAASGPSPAEALPATRDALFGLDEAVAKDALAGATGIAPGQPAAAPARVDAAVLPPQQPAGPLSAAQTAGLRGYLQAELAYTTGEPEHWSKILARLYLSTGGGRGNLKWKASARIEVNPVYDLTDHYPKAVRDADRARLFIHETYVDFASGDWEWRLGRQNVVWGEMVGLFFADVVSAKDLREFVLQDFQIMRIPQWAVRVERFGGDWHTELIWIPYPSYDLIGKPGGDFYPYPPLLPGLTPVIEAERKPARTLRNTNYGLRLGRLIDGWDLSAFYYSSMDAAAAFPRELTATTQTYRPRHERIWQAGGTLGKDLGPFVLKAEAIYTDGRKYNVKVPTADDGLVEQDTLDWVVGADFQPGTDTRLNLQLFQRIHFDHDPRIVPAAREHGASVLVHHKFNSRWEAEALFIRSLNRNDWLLRPKLLWKFQPDWRLTAGVDLLHGPQTGFFGRFSNRDRLYAELRHDF